MSPSKEKDIDELTQQTLGSLFLSIYSSIAYPLDIYVHICAYIHMIIDVLYIHVHSQMGVFPMWEFLAP